MYFLLNMGIFQRHFSFQGCNKNRPPKKPFDPTQLKPENMEGVETWTAKCLSRKTTRSQNRKKINETKFKSYDPCPRGGIKYIKSLCCFLVRSLSHFCLRMQPQ